MVLVMLMGMVLNAGQQVDQKVKMQNAADAATYSGSIVLTRGMNTLSFSNHLLFDVFALTAYMREAQERNAESYTESILNDWERIGPMFLLSRYKPFYDLGKVIVEKVPREREVVRHFSELEMAGSEVILPVLEEILATELIPQFQRAVVVTTPQQAQWAADEIAQRHGRSWPRQAEVRAVLWRTNADAVGGQSEDLRKTMPVVDPIGDDAPDQFRYFQQAVSQRRRFTHRYLRYWNNYRVRVLRDHARMSQFYRLWHTFTCGHLNRLLQDYPDYNLPYLIRNDRNTVFDTTTHLDQDFTFVGVVYRKKVRNQMPGVFRQPVQGETVAYCATRLFIPKRRLILLPWLDVGRQAGTTYPQYWNLLNQNWTTQIVPATTPRLPQILSRSPYILPNADEFQPPAIAGSVSNRDMLWINNH